MKRLIFISIFVLIFSTFSYSQTQKPHKAISSSPAFAEIILRQTEVESELEEMLVSYTEEFPKVKDARYELSVLNKSLETINRVKPEEASKLTSALGKLFVRRARVATDYWLLKNRYDDKHPQTMRAKKKLEIFDRAINKIMN